jgi:RNA polymerase sigma factor (sigma-70 family)
MDIAEDFDAIWQQHHYEVRCYLKKRVLADMVDDMVQDVYFRAWRAMLKGQGWNVNARAWLYRIARNLIIDWHRTRSREPEWIELDAIVDDMDDDGKNPLQRKDMVVSDTMTPQELVEQSEVVLRVRGALDCLADRPRQYMAWRLEGYDNAEIAQAMGERPQAVRAVNTRAFANLRQQLQGVA